MLFKAFRRSKTKQSMQRSVETMVSQGKSAADERHIMLTSLKSLKLSAVPSGQNWQKMVETTSTVQRNLPTTSWIKLEPKSCNSNVETMPGESTMHKS